MKALNLSLAVAAVGMCVYSASAKNSRPEKPNVLFLLVDDLGWQDIKCYDIDEPSPYETPRLDQLAKEGVLFWQAYSPAPTSSPSRGAILSGKHPARLGRTHVLGGSPINLHEKRKNPIMSPYFKGRLDLDQDIIPDIIKQQGYVSGHSAKWHVVVNYGSSPTPQEHGFDWSKSDIRTQHSIKPDRVGGFVDQNSDSPYKLDKNGYPTDPNNDYAIEFMELHKDKPFFLYYAPWLVHYPIQTRSKALLEKYCKKLGVEFPKDAALLGKVGNRNPYYCAMVETMDYYIGMMIDYLKSTDDPRWPGHKLYENTYIIFSSDNGGMEGSPREQYTENYPLDRGKINIQEGGIRVPLIIAGPGIAKGVESDVMINLLDVFPTILSWTNTRKPKDLILDGADISTLLAKNPKDANLVKEQNGKVRNSIFHHFPHGQMQSSLRLDGYKLYKNYDPRREHEYELYQLYDKDNKRVDLEEMKNIADANPELVKKMSAMLTERLVQVDASLPLKNPYADMYSNEKDKVCKITNAGNNGSTAWMTFEEPEHKMIEAFITYTLEPNTKNEEWFKVDAILVSKGRVEAQLPTGATHFTWALVDSEGFVNVYPQNNIAITARNKKYTSIALEVK